MERWYRMVAQFGFIGLGLMGRPMPLRLLGAGDPEDDVATLINRYR